MVKNWLLVAATLGVPVVRAERVIEVCPSGALSTPAVAVEKVRAERAAGHIGADENVTIRLAPGLYRLGRRIELGPADSHLAFVGEKGTVLSGSVALSRFVAGADGIWRTKVPSGMTFEQLYVNGRRAVRAKSPNRNFYYVRRPVYECDDPVTGKRIQLNRQGFYGLPEDLAEIAKLSQDERERVVFRSYYGWDTDWTTFRHVDAKTGLAIFKTSVGRNFFQWPEYCCRYQVENFRAALDAPGEWFLDVKAGELLYMPLPGETTDATMAEAPVLDRWLVIKGDRTGEKSVRNVTFRNLVFDKSGYKLPKSLFTGQGAVRVDASIEVRGAENIVFENCEISNTGGYALWLAKGVRHSRVAHCRFRELGAGGIRIGDRTWTKDEMADPSLLTGFVTVDNCIISDGGRQFPAGMGVMLMHAADCRITHNEICNFCYSGISAGWTWGYGPTVVRRNEILFNHVHHLGLGIMGDMGGIYTLGDSRGTRIIGNVIHDIVSYDRTGSGSCGLYADEGSRGIYAASNVIWNTNTQGINQHYGIENVFADNTIVEPSPKDKGYAITVHRYSPPLAAAFSNNVIYASGAKPIYSRARSLDQNKWDDVPRVGNVVRPLSEFVVPGRGKAGVYGDAAWIAEADAIVPEPVRDIPQPPRYEGLTSWETGFEAYRDGSGLPDVFGRQSDGGDYTNALITSEVAATGRRSVAVFDGSGLKYAHSPHFSRSGLNATNGALEVWFSLRLDPGVFVEFECRDYHPKAEAGAPAKAGVYAVPARLRVVDGKVVVSASGIKRSMLCDYTPGTWIKCRLKAEGLGTDRSRYTYSVVGPDGVEHVVTGGSNDSRARGVDWFGFLTPGKSDRFWYLDDFGWKVSNDAATPSAQDATAEVCPYEYEIATDHENAVYGCGETAAFTVKVLDAGRLASSGKIVATVDNFGSRRQLTETFDLSKSNPFVVRGRCATPGFLKLSLAADGQKTKVWGVAYEPEKIRPATARPADFDAFWDEATRKLAAEVPVDMKQERLTQYCTDRREVYLVSFATVGGRRVYGFLTLPKDLSKGPYPVRLSVPGAGPSLAIPDGDGSCVRLVMNVHYYRPLVGEARHSPRNTAAQRAEDQEWFDRFQARGYCKAGIWSSREDYFYYGAILGIDRAFDWVVAQSYSDRTDVTYSGVSQGGAFGLAMTALNPYIRRCFIGLPALSDLMSYKVEDRQPGWPSLIWGQPVEKRAAAERWAPYFDGAHFAAAIRCPVRVAVGFADTTCPPHAVYATYNVMPSGDKAIIDCIGCGHTPDRRYEKASTTWVAEK